jgi:TniQ protein
MDNSFLWPEVVSSDTGYQESFTSFLYRTAELNGISVADLVSSLIEGVPYPSQLFSDLAGNGPCTLEGCSARSLPILKVLSGVPPLSRLSLHTCWPLVNVLSGVRLLRRNCAWCPICLEALRRIDERKVYQPLLWRFNHVLRCPIHDRPLSVICPYCGVQPRTFSTIGRVGCCANCGRWLGKASYVKNDGIPNDLGDELSVLDILSNLERISACDANFFETANSAVSRGIVTKDKLRTVLTSEITLYKESLPTLETVLRVSALSGISPVNLLLGNVNIVEAASYQRERTKVPGHREFDYDAAVEKMERASRQHPDLSLSTLCKQAGIARTSFVANRPIAAGRIRKRYKCEMRKRKAHELKLIERAIDRLIKRRRYPSWNAIKKECPGVYTDQEYMDVVNELLAARGFVRNARGYLVAK